MGQLTAPSSNQLIFTKRKQFPCSTVWRHLAEFSGPSHTTAQHTGLHADTVQSTYTSARCLQGPVRSAPKSTSHFSWGLQPLRQQTRLNASGREWNPMPISNPQELCSPQEGRLPHLSRLLHAGGQGGLTMQARQQCPPSKP